MRDIVPNLSILKAKIPEFSATNSKKELKINPSLNAHMGWSRTFKKSELTFGLIAPFKGYADTPTPEFSDLATLAKIAENSGFSTLLAKRCAVL